MTVTDPAGTPTTYVYDLAGRKLSVDNPSAGKTTFTYDNLGNVLTKTTGKGERKGNKEKCSATVAKRLRRLPTIACSDNRYHGRCWYIKSGLYKFWKSQMAELRK